MKKVILSLGLVVILILLSGCFKDRNELFNIPISSGTYSYVEDDTIGFLDKEITGFSITFIDTNTTTEELDNYDKNLFGDYSSSDIKIYEIIIEIEFENIKQNCDAVFMGVANPQRPNAYKLIVTIPDLNEQQEDFRMIIDFDVYGFNEESLNRIYIQIGDEINTVEDKMDATFYIDYKENESH